MRRLLAVDEIRLPRTTTGPRVHDRLLHARCRRETVHGAGTMRDVLTRVVPRALRAAPSAVAPVVAGSTKLRGCAHERRGGLSLRELYSLAERLAFHAVAPGRPGSPLAACPQRAGRALQSGWWTTWCDGRDRHGLTSICTTSRRSLRSSTGRKAVTRPRGDSSVAGRAVVHTGRLLRHAAAPELERAQATRLSCISSSRCDAAHRNSDLDFSSVPGLLYSRERRRPPLISQRP